MCQVVGPPKARFEGGTDSAPKAESVPPRHFPVYRPKTLSQTYTIFSHINKLYIGGVIRGYDSLSFLYEGYREAKYYHTDSKPAHCHNIYWIYDCPNPPQPTQCVQRTSSIHAATSQWQAILHSLDNLITEEYFIDPPASSEMPWQILIIHANQVCAPMLQALATGKVCSHTRRSWSNSRST